MNNGSDISDADLAALFGLSTDEADALGIDRALATSPDQPPPGPPDQQAPILQRADGPLVPLGPGEQASPAATATPQPPTDAALASLPPPAPAPGAPTPLRRIQQSGPPPADAPPASPDPQPGSYPAVRPSGEPASPPPASLPSASLAAPQASAPAVNPELAAAFAEESAELLDGFHVQLEALEHVADDWEAVREARRTVHTLKGAASVCGFQRVVRLAHASEDLLDAPMNTGVALPPAALRLLFAAEPLLRLAVEVSLSGGPPIPTADDEAMINQLHVAAVASAGQPAPPTPPNTAPTAAAAPDPDLVSPAATPEGGQRGDQRLVTTLNVGLDRVDELVNKVTQLLANRAASQGALSKLVKASTEATTTAQRIQRLLALLSAEYAVARLSEASSRDSAARGGATTTSALTTLMLQLAEAVTDQSAVLANLKADIVSRWALGAAEQRLDGEIHSALLGIRLVPLGNLRVRLDRAVRSAAGATGKAVTLRMHGGDVAVEKNVFDRIYEPLLHLLRNSVDHGIELPQVRQARGKPEMGTITISSRDEGNGVVVRVADDGGGIDPTMVAARALERGVISPEALAAMGDQQKKELVFTHGFSTAPTIGDLSGRGVGMDIVRQTVTRMGGSIELFSRAGRGTTFTLRLPVTLSLARALVVRDGSALAALPATGVRAVHLVGVGDIEESDPVGPEAPGGGARLRRPDGRHLPLVTLPLSLGAGTASYTRLGELHVLEIPYEGASVGLLVEELVTEEEAVIKPLPALLRHSGLFLGALILASGQPAPLLNLPQVLAQARPARLRRPPPEASGSTGPARALVVDDSLSMRVALTQTLQKAGFIVTTAQDGRQALDAIAASGMPDVITLDVEMPRMGGLETLYAIRHSPGGAATPVFMISSRAAEGDRATALSMGATRYFAKPYPPEELIAAARVIIQPTPSLYWS